MNPVHKFHFMEVDEQADGHIEKFHVAQELSFVDRQNGFDRLDLDQHATLDQQIKAKRFFFGKTFVGNQDSALVDELNLPQLEFFGQTPFVYGLDQPWTFVAMDFNGCANDVFSE